MKGSYYWLCCECGEGPWNPKICSSCAICGHIGCSACSSVTSLYDSEEEDGLFFATKKISNETQFLPARAKEQSGLADPAVSTNEPIPPFVETSKQTQTPDGKATDYYSSTPKEVAPSLSRFLPHQTQVSFGQPNLAEDRSSNSNVQPSSSNEDIRHLLDPQTYFDDLDRLEAAVAEDLHLSPSSIQSFTAESLCSRWLEPSACSDDFEMLDIAIGRLITGRLCSDSFSVLIQDPTRVDVALARKVDLTNVYQMFHLVKKTTGHWRDQLEHRHAIPWEPPEPLDPSLPDKMKETLEHIANAISYTLPSKANPSSTPGPWFDWLRSSCVRSDLSEVYVFLAFAILSYSGSHASPFDQVVFQGQQSTFTIGKNIDLRKCRLACLDQYIGGPLRVFVPKHMPLNTEYAISIAPNVFADLWGPLWACHGHPAASSCKGYRTERGLLYATAPQIEAFSEDRVVRCHWKEISSREWANDNTTYHAIPPDAELLIGQVPTFTINSDCNGTLKTMQANKANQLVFSGTSNSYSTFEGHEIGTTAGYVNPIGRPSAGVFNNAGYASSPAPRGLRDGPQLPEPTPVSPFRPGFSTSESLRHLDDSGLVVSRFATAACSKTPFKLSNEIKHPRDSIQDAELEKLDEQNWKSLINTPLQHAHFEKKPSRSVTTPKSPGARTEAAELATERFLADLAIHVSSHSPLLVYSAARCHLAEVS